MSLEATAAKSLHERIANQETRICKLERRVELLDKMVMRACEVLAEAANMDGSAFARDLRREIGLVEQEGGECGQGDVHEGD